MLSKILEVEHLSFCYPKSDKLAVNDISFVVEKGSFISILGANGSGKTTLLKLIAGLLTPQSGKIKKNFDFSALVFQNSDNQFVSDIVEEDVAFGPENLCLSSEKIQKIVDESLKKVGMLDYKNRLISSLSEGQKQRVAIAGALALSSDVLILDEPASMLCEKEYWEITDLICELNKNGVTVICVTQDTNLALLSDRIIVMKNGSIKSEFSSKKFIEKFDEVSDCGFDLPQHIKLAKLLNEKGLNISYDKLDCKHILEGIERQC